MFNIIIILLIHCTVSDIVVVPNNINITESTPTQLKSSDILAYNGPIMDEGLTIIMTEVTGGYFYDEINGRMTIAFSQGYTKYISFHHTHPRIKPSCWMTAANLTHESISKPCNITFFAYPKIVNNTLTFAPNVKGQITNINISAVDLSGKVGGSARAFNSNGWMKSRLVFHIINVSNGHFYNSVVNDRVNSMSDGDIKQGIIYFVSEAKPPEYKLRVSSSTFISEYEKGNVIIMGKCEQAKVYKYGWTFLWFAFIVFIYSVSMLAMYRNYRGNPSTVTL